MIRYSENISTDDSLRQLFVFLKSVLSVTCDHDTVLAIGCCQYSAYEKKGKQDCAEVKIQVCVLPLNSCQVATDSYCEKLAISSCPLVN